MGRLIPAGTGLEQYKGMGIQVELPEVEPGAVQDAAEGGFDEATVGASTALPGSYEAEPGALDG